MHFVITWLVTALILLLDVKIHERFLVPVGNYPRYAQGGWGQFNMLLGWVTFPNWLEETYFLALPLTHAWV